MVSKGARKREDPKHDEAPPRPSQVRREQRRNLPPPDPASRYSVPDALVYLDLSRKGFYGLVKAGHLRLIKNGRRSYCPGSEIIRLSTLPAMSA